MFRAVSPICCGAEEKVWVLSVGTDAGESSAGNDRDRHAQQVWGRPLERLSFTWKYTRNGNVINCSI